jgi:hypothetical protein
MGAFASLTNSAIGTCSVPELLGVLDLPQLHGAYHDPFRTDDAVKTMFLCPVAPVLHLADCSGLARHDGADKPAVRGRDENYTRSCQYSEKRRAQLVQSMQWDGSILRAADMWCRGVQCGGEAETNWQAKHVMPLMRTFLDALDLRTTACRELSAHKWAGRSPLLGSIVRCRPKSVVEFAMLSSFCPPSPTRI